MTYTDVTPPANSTTTLVSSTTSAQTIIAANTQRVGLYIYNLSTAALYLLLGNNSGGEVTSTRHTVKLVPSALYEMPVNYYGGEIRGIWDAVNGTANVTEFTQ